jgi:hypothetical protein
MSLTIKKNFIYRKIHNYIHRKDSGVNLVFIGRPGSGKSTAAMKVCIDLDPTFNTNRICHSIKEVLELMVYGDKDTGKLKPGQAILMDEIVNEQGAYSRQSLSKTNVTFAYLFANFRAKRLIFCICLPKLTQLDKDIRDVGVHGIFRLKSINFKEKKSKASFYWNTVNEFGKASRLTLPRLVDMTTNEVLKVKNIWIDAPSKEFTDLYKIKKMQYIEDKEKIWLNKVSRESKNETLKEGKEYSTLLEKIGKSKDKFLSGVNYDKEKIMVEFNLGEFKARMLSKLASKQYPINIAPKVLGNDEAFYNKIKELNE